MVKGMFIAIGLLILAGVGCFVLYDFAYSKGETTGYDNGYSAGHEAGHSKGYSQGQETGYTEGYSSGKTDGYNEGYTSGRADGYEVGYGSGKTEGHQAGYAEGMEAGLGHGYTLKDPTYEEVVTFLTEDKTDKNEYIEDTYGVYVCSHFARDVCNNAEEAGLRCAFIELRYPEGGHAIIAFNTIDEGLAYFEPLTDERARPVVGKRYYQCIEPKPGYYYVKPSVDDTIMDILVIW
ncbi:MAG: hypothetical protein ACETVS_02875 [Dehalococcoidales bacterium]